MNKKRLLAVATAVVLCVCLAALTACAKAPETAQGQQDSDSSGSQAAAAMEWSADSDCSACHAAEAESLGTVQTAAAHSGNGCLSCHSDEAHLKEVHESSDGDSVPAKLSSAGSIGSDICLGCHSTDTLKAATADGPALIDEEGTSVNPHDRPEGHLGEKVDCADCHSVHAGSSPLDNAESQCASCHHEGVYQCGTCHE